MKKLILLLLLSTTAFAQVDTGEITKSGRKIYEKVFDNASTEITQTLKIDNDIYQIFDHKGVFRIGAHEGFNKFPFKMFTKYKGDRTLMVITASYEIEGNNIKITAKNSVDDLVFALGIQYYIVVRYTKN